MFVLHSILVHAFCVDVAEKRTIRSDCVPLKTVRDEHGLLHSLIFPSHSSFLKKAYHKLDLGIDSGLVMHLRNS